MERKKTHIIVDLIFKSWKGTLSPAEEVELNELMKHPQWARMKADLENDRFVMECFRKYERYDTDADFSIFLNRVKQLEKPKVKGIGKRLAYAASVLLFVLGSVFYYQFDFEEVQGTTKQNVLCESVNRNGIRLIMSNEKMINLTNQEKSKELDSMGIELMDHSQTLNYLQVTKIDTLSQELVYHTLLVPKGQIYTLILSDSSRVVLNAETKMKYPVCFGNDKREVYIEGEAYFEVAKNPSAPFIVTGKNYTLQVLGTSFNVMSYDEEFTSNITLLSGSVKMNVRDSSFCLRPGEQVAISHENQFKVQRVDVDLSVLWMQKKFNFDSEKLEDIFRKISRWYGVEVIYEAPALREIRYSGIVPNDIPLSELLEMLNHTTDIKYTLQDGVVTVSRVGK